MSPRRPFDSEDEAKNYAVSLMARVQTRAEAERTIDTYRLYFANAESSEDQSLWKAEIDSIQHWLESEEFAIGGYATGLDTLYLQMIEWRASLFAFDQIDTDVFGKHLFFAQWLSGASHAVFVTLGKLVSEGKKDISLIKLWREVRPYISASGLPDDGEMSQIKLVFNGERFTNMKSPPINFRNNAIAHNRESPRLTWDDVDVDLKIIARIWGLMSSWCSFGVVNPFQDSVIAFSGLESVFSSSQMKELCEAREQFLDKAKAWSRTSLVTGQVVPGRSAFSELSVKMKNESS